MTDQHVSPPDARLINGDLAPVRVRTWGWADYLFLWMSDVHSVAGYLTAGSLFAMGLPPGDVFLALMLGILVVHAVCNVIAVPSFRTGAPFPVVARMAFGVRGAIIPALVRGVIAVGWYGIQTWLASNAVLLLVLRFLPGLAVWADVTQHGWAGLSLLGWAAFLLVWLLQTAIFWRGMETIRHFLDWAGPVIYGMMILLDLWLLWAAGGHVDFSVFPSPTTHFPQRLGLLLNAVALIVAYFSPIVLNFGDFARYGHSMADIKRGNFWGLPVNFLGFSVLTLLTITLTKPVFGQLIFDPVETVARIDSPTAVTVGVVTFVVATMGINISANFVSAAFDFSNLAPTRISWRTGGLLAAGGAILVTPWNLYARPELIHLTLDVLGTFLAPLTGILLADYYLIRRGQIIAEDLYSAAPQGSFWYVGGFNPVAILTLLLTVTLGLVMLFVPALAALENFSWLIGLGLGAGLYTALSRSGEAISKARP